MPLFRLLSSCLLAWCLMVLLGCPDPQDKDCDPAVDPSCDPCEGETVTALCQSTGSTCGLSMVVDRCGQERELDCGPCPDCEPESVSALCAAEGILCGAADAVDRCGDRRNLDCGPCPCYGETSVELCARDQVACGPASAVDRCGATRDIDCGECADRQMCIDGQCGCEAESDEALCRLAGSACGSLEADDRCGQRRVIDCGTCQPFEAYLGSVRDARTGALLADATMRVHQWPPRGAEEDGLWVWPVGFRRNQTDFSITTAQRGPGQRNYGFVDGVDTCDEAHVEGKVRPDGWYRIRIDLPGYAPGIFYRYHWGFDEGCTLDDCAGVVQGGQCRVEDFELWPLSEPYPLYPDLFIDPRDLHDQEWQCAIMPADHPHRHLIGLRHTVGATNIGMGPLHLRGVGQDGRGGGIVYQRIVWSDGTHEDRLVPEGAFEFSETHEHIHFQAFVDMYLVQARPECVNPFRRPEACVTAQENRKVSWCLMDDSHFDREILSAFNGNRSYIYPSVCENFIQGITQGWKDYYDKDLPGQVVVLGPPSAADSMGPRWLEVMIDPANYLSEMTRFNNVSRVLIDVPSPTMNLCNANTALDCSVPVAQFGFQQRRQCPAYLNFR
jgi:hypothetical protein